MFEWKLAIIFASIFSSIMLILIVGECYEKLKPLNEIVGIAHIKHITSAKLLIWNDAWHRKFIEIDFIYLSIESQHYKTDEEYFECFCYKHQVLKPTLLHITQNSTYFKWIASYFIPSYEHFRWNCFVISSIIIIYHMLLHTTLKLIRRLVAHNHLIKCLFSRN